MFHLNNIPATLPFHQQELLMTAVVCNKFKQFFACFYCSSFYFLVYFSRILWCSSPSSPCWRPSYPPSSSGERLQNTQGLIFTPVTIFLANAVDPDPGPNQTIVTLKQCCGSGSGAFLTPGSGIGFFRILDLGSPIPNPYFWELTGNFLGKKCYNSLKIGQKFFLQHFKTKIIFKFVKFVAT